MNFMGTWLGTGRCVAVSNLNLKGGARFASMEHMK